MYALVKLLKGYQQPLLYEIPDTFSRDVHVGSIVHVPFRTSKTSAIVLKLQPYKPNNVSFTIKPALSLQPFPIDKNYAPFLEKTAHLYFSDAHTLYQRLTTFLATKAKMSDEPPLSSPLSDHNHAHSEVTLTNEQTSVVDYITEKMEAPTFAPTLVHGITGSGKTEVYKRIIATAFTANKSVLLLLPEVSLSLQFERILSAQLPSHIPLFSFHSATKPKDRRELWQHLIHNKPCLIVGVHLPVFLPIGNLGCIIIDEEHETGFQEKKHPKINSKQAALLRAQIAKIPVLLGSATPSLTSLAQVEKKKWAFFSITKRFSGTLPTVKRVMLDARHKRKCFWITRELEKEITATLNRGEQVIVYLNRRGFSFFVQCKLCGHIFECNDCSVSLTLHKAAGEHADDLRCHYCSYHTKLPESCPGCKAPGKHLLKKGIGTQQMTGMIQKMFPHARVARADLDTTKKKREWFKTVEQFSNGEIDILVGTQLITKGYHFPNVTLVGVIWADLNLHFPIYDASETSLQKLIQVAGRAGRGHKKSMVIVQAMQDHPIFNFLDETKYLAFCEQEKVFRQQTKYPPYARLISIELKHTSGTTVDDDALALVEKLDAIATQLSPEISVLGPTQPLVSRIAKTESRLIYIKAPSFAVVRHMIDQIDFKKFESSVFVTPEG